MGISLSIIIMRYYFEKISNDILDDENIKDLSYFFTCGVWGLHTMPTRQTKMLKNMQPCNNVVLKYPQTFISTIWNKPVLMNGLLWRMETVLMPY